MGGKCDFCSFSDGRALILYPKDRNKLPPKYQNIHQFHLYKEAINNTKEIQKYYNIICRNCMRITLYPNIDKDFCKE